MKTLNCKHTDERTEHSNSDISRRQSLCNESDLTQKSWRANNSYMILVNRALASRGQGREREGTLTAGCATQHKMFPVWIKTKHSAAW